MTHDHLHAHSSGQTHSHLHPHVTAHKGGAKVLHAHAHTKTTFRAPGAAMAPLKGLKVLKR